MIFLKHLFYEVENSSTQQTERILEDINLEFSKGQVYAIVGANGAGKSTLLDIISGTKNPTAGYLTNNAQDVHQNRRSFLRYLEKVSYCIQNAESAFFHKTVKEELLFSSQNQELLDQLVRDYDLQEALELSPFQLSGGQKKRLLFVLNLLNEPSILLTDELTAGLDQEGKSAMMGEIISHKDKRITIMVTHNLEDALYYADNLIVLSDSRVTFAGKTNEVIEDSSLLTSAGFQMPETFLLCQQLIQSGIFNKGDYYLNSKEIAKQLLLQFKGEKSDE
ncbi:energy-coupling factor transporter ATP-binding protein EcfA2 [Tetragenococcus halophilus subsp. flandriensis]|uniref:ATP-binding cassette domain-containing protein n=1 Tax=Tetragenococcus halophilus TaxID=51669 RepID=UPI0023E9A016|nr:ATP-binding cassette domain-containing protein [Tetragenococcus halophilus]GMA08145.1 energy-coupling factor transporter ATP-binding protein EcfA2 [Tetragenococcus halophilus subsp. flandriensis]